MQPESITKSVIELSWEEVNRSVELLAQTISRAPVDKIIAIARGGIIPGVMLSHCLKVPLKIVWAHSYEGTHHIKRPPAIIGFDRRWVGSDPSRIVVVDDIVDSGQTLEQVWKLMGNEIRFVSIVNKQPDLYDIPFHHFIALGTWVRFPWELESQ